MHRVAQLMLLGGAGAALALPMEEDHPEREEERRDARQSLAELRVLEQMGEEEERQPGQRE